MDPNTCFAEMLDFAEAREWDDAVTRADDLLQWLERGGFPPQDMTAEQASAEALRVIDDAETDEQFRIACDERGE